MPSLELGSQAACQNVTIAGNTTDLSGGTIPAVFTANGTQRISMAVDTAVTVNIRFTPTGGSAVNFPLFEGAALVVNAPRTTILRLPEGVTFTVRFSAACVVQFFSVENVMGGTL